MYAALGVCVVLLHRFQVSRAKQEMCPVTGTLLPTRPASFVQYPHKMQCSHSKTSFYHHGFCWDECESIIVWSVQLGVNGNLLPVTLL